MTKYLLSQRDSPDLERSRLRLLQEYHDPLSLRQLDAIDPDFTTVALSPTTSTWERTWSVFCDALIVGGWDPRYGARLCGDLRAAGLVEIQADYIASCDAGGSVVSRLLSLTFERLREQMGALGAGNEEIDESRRLLEDPANTIHSPTTCVARARRPART